MTVGYLAIENDTISETREMISLSAILAAIILWNLITVWQIRSHTNRLIKEIRAMGTSPTDVEHEQAHQEQTP